MISFNISMISFNISLPIKDPGRGKEDFYLLPTPVLVPVVIVIAVLILTTVTGNLLVIISYQRDKSLRTIYNIYILNLAIADMLIGVSSMSFYSVYTITMFHWPLGRAMCKIFMCMDFTLCPMTVLLMIILSLDRLILIRTGAAYIQRETRRVAYIKVTVSWIFAFSLYGPANIGWDYWVGESAVADGDCNTEFNNNFEYTLATALVEFVIPFVSIIVLNTLIYLKIRKRNTLSFQRKWSVVPFSTNDINGIGLDSEDRSIVNGINPGRTSVNDPNSVDSSVSGNNTGNIGGNNPYRTDGTIPGNIGGNNPRGTDGTIPGNIGGNNPHRTDGTIPGNIGGDNPHKTDGTIPGNIGRNNPHKTDGTIPGSIGRNNPHRPDGTIPGKFGGNNPHRTDRTIPGNIGRNNPHRPDGTIPGKFGGNNPHRTDRTIPGNIGRNNPHRTDGTISGNIGGDNPHRTDGTIPGNIGGDNPHRTDGTIPGNIGGDKPDNSIGDSRRISFGGNRSIRVGRESRERKAAKTLFVLVIVFAVCWTPYTVATVLSALCHGCVNSYAYEFFIWLLWTKSCINPFLYAYTSSTFRKNFKHLLLCQRKKF